MGFYEEVDEP